MRPFVRLDVAASNLARCLRKASDEIIDDQPRELPQAA